MADTLITVLTAVGPPALAVAGKIALSNREPTQLKRMKRHSDLLEHLPADAQVHMERLLAAESENYADDQIFRMKRKLDGGSLAALIFVGVLTAGVIVAGFALAGVLHAPWVHFITGTVALFGLLLMIVGLGQVWKDPEASSQSRQSSNPESAV
ncbi:hypothetical protein DEJ33_15775 [Curtobacterium sp. MCPF17_047]|uniref:hypothetical protein n=1 Tax=Curtobacterium sp. MCPF17_047 TaxID=2175654 RepID=UPI000DA70930|nr:hypothetical protein [Curtobacterium sp. MCPF17_047]PZF61891.1 hypothetical protein DEJ33_15775 [Curtobacterium sp. MCPF17_047]